MSQQVSMGDVIRAIDALGTRLDNLESEVRRLAGSEGRWNVAHGLVGTIGNRTDVHFAFLVELLRQNGILKDADVRAAEGIVREHIAGKERSWSASEAAADENVTAALSVLAGDYSAD